MLAAGVRADQLCFCRIQSTHCENNDYEALLSNLDHHMLLHLALGFECRVYDFGSRGNKWRGEEGGLEERYVPRAIWLGLEWHRYVLNNIWHLPAASKPVKLRGYDSTAVFRSAYERLPKAIRKKLKYYRNFLSPRLQEVQLRGYYAQAFTDGDKAAHKVMLDAFAQEVAKFELSGPPPPESFGMRRYDADVDVRWEQGS